MKLSATKLANFMQTTRDSRFFDRSQSSKKNHLSFQLNNSKNKYVEFTNLTKNQQLKQVRKTLTARKKDWKYDFYRTNQNFSRPVQQQMQEFPHNNHKYNVQFLDRSLRGRSLKFPAKQLGLFPKTEKKLYSDHYKPILDQKLNYNQNYQLRASLFGYIQLDEKRQRIMDQYHLQANPFRTQKSNNLLSRLRANSEFR